MTTTRPSAGASADTAAHNGRRSPSQLGKHRWRPWLYALGGLGLAGLVLYAMRPQPVAVDLATVERGALQVTIDAEGQTRVRDRYVVAAPVDGELQRIALKAGDPITVGATVAQIHPLALTSQVEAKQAQRRATEARLNGVETQRPKPAALNQAETRIRATQAQVVQAQARVTEVTAALAQADRDRDRMATLYAQGGIARQDLETLTLAVTQRQQDLAAAQQQVTVAQADQQAAEEALAVLIAEVSDPDYLVDVYEAELAAIDAELAGGRTSADSAGAQRPLCGRWYPPAHRRRSQRLGIGNRHSLDRCGAGSAGKCRADRALGGQ